MPDYFENAGEWGLRWRLRLATRIGYSRAVLAELLDISEAALSDYLDNPSHVLSDEDYDTVLTNLSVLQGTQPHVSDRPLPSGEVLYYVQSPWWDGNQLENVVTPGHAIAFKVHYLSASESHRPMSTDMYTLPENDPQETAFAACEGDLDRLIAIIFYEYND